MRLTELSSLTTGEWVKLKATLLAIDNREFHCGSCLSKYSGRSDADKMTKASRAVKGCFEIKKRPVFTIQDEEKTETIEFSRCPGNYFDQGALNVIHLHRYFRAGHLPFPGSISDQPNKVMEAFNVIDAYQAERAEIERKKNAQKQERLLKGATRGR